MNILLCNLHRVVALSSQAPIHHLELNIKINHENDFVHMVTNKTILIATAVMMVKLVSHFEKRPHSQSKRSCVKQNNQHKH